MLTQTVLLCWNGPKEAGVTVLACHDCQTEIVTYPQFQAIADGVAHRLSVAIPRVCISCALTRSRLLNGEHIAALGPGRAVAAFQEALSRG